MKDIRIGNDISVRWSLYKGDEAYDLTNLPVTLYLKNAYGKKKVENYAVNGNQISWTFFGKDQKNTGKYSMVLVIREGEQGMASTDYCDFVQLVSCACQVSGADDENVQTETIELTSEVDFLPIIVDTALSESSLNPIANKAVAEKFAEVEGKMALQPDWNQSDPISKDYIKNRTHGIVFHGDPRESNYNGFLKSLTNPTIMHVGGNTIATFHTGYHSLYDYDTFLFQLGWGSTTDNILDGIIPTNRSVSVGTSTSVVLNFRTFGSVTEDGEFVEHYQTTITFNDSEGWNVDEVISALCEQYCLLINEDFEIAKLDQRYIPETIARKSELLELLEDKANKDDIEQPNWDAGKTEKGYILGRTHYIELANTQKTQLGNKDWELVEENESGLNTYRYKTIFYEYDSPYILYDSINSNPSLGEFVERKVLRLTESWNVIVNDTWDDVEIRLAKQVDELGAEYFLIEARSYVSAALYICTEELPIKYIPDYFIPSTIARSDEVDELGDILSTEVENLWEDMEHKASNTRVDALESRIKQLEDIVSQITEEVK